MKGIIFILPCLLIFLIGCQVATVDNPEPEPETPIDPGPAGHWVEMGPAPIGNTGCTGRVSAIGVSKSNADLYYVGGADGGVWKTENGGASWRALTDHLPTTAIGAVAVDPTNDEIVYAGSGEANFANHSRHGLGLYKTTDGGDNWEVLAADTFSGRCFSRLLIDPDNTQTLYAAITHAGGLPAFRFTMAGARGHWGAQMPLGVWKSADGGHSWEQLSGGLPGDLSATDMMMNPTGPAVLYAAIGHVFGDTRNGIYKSTDHGASWSKLSGGLPGSGVGRIALAVTPAAPNRIYASIIMASDMTGGGAFTQGVYRSDDGGNSWIASNPVNAHGSYGWYLNVMAVSPTDPDTAFVGGIHLYKTSDGGGPWTDVLGSQHVDFHALEYDAAGRLVSGTDGGVYRSDNLGQSWTSLNNGLGIVQFYAGVSLDPDDPSVIYGGTQDNGTLKKTGAGTGDWIGILGGDGGCTGVKPDDSRVVFAEYQRAGNIFKSGNYGQDFSRSANGIDTRDPNAFVSPFDFEPGRPDTMYYATNRLYQSTDAGGSWSAVSGDLTGETGAAVRGFAIAPSEASTFYAGTNDGRVLVSFNAGQSWDVSLVDVPGWPRIMRQFAVDPSDHLTAFLAVSYFGTDQILTTGDGGGSWVSLDNDLTDIPVNTVIIDPRRGAQVLYLGTDAGVYRSTDGGGHWERFGEGLPNCVVNDLKFDTINNRLIAATQGRGMWRLSIQ